MKEFDLEQLKNLFVLPKDAHKGQGGKLMIIGGSHLFHGASLWALAVASRIVDMVFYSSVPENNELTQKLKGEIYDFIAIPRDQIESYIEEADCILLGPGMVRTEEPMRPTVDYQISSLSEIEQIEHEGIQTYYLTKYLLNKYTEKKWVIDAGALQMLEVEWIPKNAILTPHHGEFSTVQLKSQKSLHFGGQAKVNPDSIGVKSATQNSKLEEGVGWFAKEYNCVVLLKGEKDIVCDSKECVEVAGGNEGMVKGGTGDVLAGLVAALSCKNDLFLAACSASYINKKAGELLYKEVGPYFNATDLANAIPRVMKKLLA